MRVHAINLIRRGGDALQAAGDGGTAYALHEFANNLLRVMRGEETFEEFCRVYVHDRAEILDLDKHLPVPEEE